MHPWGEYEATPAEISASVETKTVKFWYFLTAKSTD